MVMPPAEWNNTTASFPSDRCMHQLVAEQAARTPDAVALVTEDVRLTYAQLNRRANQFAHYLISLGFQEFFFSKIVKLQWETIWGYKENSKSQSLEQYYF